MSDEHLPEEINPDDEYELNSLEDREQEIIEQFRERSKQHAAQKLGRPLTEVIGDEKPVVHQTPNDRSRITKPHLSVVHSVYHQQPGEQPEGVDHRFSRVLEQDEQWFRRKSSVGGQWKPVELSWAGDCAMLVITNDEGRSFVRNPSEDEVNRLAEKAIEVCLMPSGHNTPEGRRDMHSPPKMPMCPMIFIPPGEDVRFNPCDGITVYVRSRGDTARFTVIAIPS